MAKAKREFVKMEDFVAAVESSESNEEVAQKTGLKITSVQQRILKLRKIAPSLKKFARQGRLTAADVNATLAKIRGVDVSVVNVASTSQAEQTA